MLRPGGPVNSKPYQDLNKNWYYNGDKLNGKDEAYSLLYWKKYENNEELVEGIKEAMRKNIERAIEDGFLGMFAGNKGIDNGDKEKMSAYRIFAKKEMNIDLGKFKYNSNSYGVTAEVIS